MDCETLYEAVKQALYADDHGNGTGCTRSFVVRRTEYDISVVRKTTFDRPTYFLFTARIWGDVQESVIVEDIETALGMEDSNVTVTLEEHDDCMTAIVPVEFRQV